MTEPVLRNSASLLLVTLASKALRWLALIVVAREYSQEVFGQFALVVASAELFRVGAEFGLDLIVTKWIADPSRSESGVLSAAIRAKLMMSAVGGVLAVATALLFGFPEPVIWGVAISAAGFIPFGLANLVRARYQARISSGRLVVPIVAVNVVYLLAVVFGAMKHISVPALVALGVAADVALLAALLLILRRDEVEVATVPGGIRIREILLAALPVGILAIVIASYARISWFLVAGYVGETGLARFASAYRLSEVVLVISGTFTLSLLPVFTRSFVVGELAQSKFIPYLRMVHSYVVPLMLVMTLFSRELMTVTFSASFADAGPVLAVLSWSVVFASTNMFLTHLLYATDRQATVLLVGLFNLAVNVGLNLVLIPRYGAGGAAVAALVTEACNTCLQTAVLFRARVMHPNRALVLLGLKAGFWVGVAIVAYLGSTPTVSPLLASSLLAAFFVSAVISGEYSSEEWRGVLRLLRGR